jgi:hypothetical protein
MTDRIERTYNSAELVHTGVDIARVVIEDEQGRRGIAFLSAHMRNGRPRFVLTTKKNHDKETIVAATADWVI